jgi:hypothetical protein
MPRHHARRRFFTRPSSRASTLAIIAVLSTTAACARPHAAPTFSLLVHVESDPGHPLPGAAVSYAGESVGKTGDTGTLTLNIHGTEGERISLKVACPEGYVSPVQPTEVTLHRLAEAGKKAEYDVTCPSVNRRVALVVRADHGPRLPVLYLGKEVARTDESGAAHALLSVPANEDAEITIGTGEAGAERLRPQNPSMKFVPSDQDDVKVLNVAFAQEPAKRVYVAPPASTLPVRLH